MNISMWNEYFYVKLIFLCERNISMWKEFFYVKGISMWKKYFYVKGIFLCEINIYMWNEYFFVKWIFGRLEGVKMDEFISERMNKWLKYIYGWINECPVYIRPVHVTILN